MPRRIRISREARTDLSRILRHTRKHFGEAKYHAYRKLLQDALVEIADDPSGPRVKLWPEVAPSARSIHLARPGAPARHFVLFSEGDDGAIHVARILYDGMDLPRRILESFDTTDDKD